jgi:hypothetical protein
MRSRKSPVRMSRPVVDEGADDAVDDPVAERLGGGAGGGLGAAADLGGDEHLIPLLFLVRPLLGV